MSRWRKQNFFVEQKDPTSEKAALVGLLTNERPTEILGLKGHATFLLEVDFLLLTRALEKMLAGKDETASEKLAEMDKAYEMIKKHERATGSS